MVMGIRGGFGWKISEGIKPVANYLSKYVHTNVFFDCPVSIRLVNPKGVSHVRGALKQLKLNVYKNLE